MNKINVTKSFLPPFDEYEEYLKRIWESGQLTNQGPVLQEFEAKTKAFLGVENFHFVANGTLALQLALRALDITEGEVITTPFSYVATTSAILWERCVPVYVDIEPKTFCIDADKIEGAITKNTKAILAVHVFGFPCNVEKIESIAKEHGLKVIYDGAHAFGAMYKGSSLLSHGDVSTCSFHATKSFHTTEGGAVIARDEKVSDKLELMKKFGCMRDEHITLGINAKASELQAAMGLCNLVYIDEIIANRRERVELYNRLLDGRFQVPHIPHASEHNYAYYPLLFDNEKQLLSAVKALNEYDIYPRRYFYPSLNKLPYLKNHQDCPISESIASRILCLPLYADLEEDIIRKICQVLLK